MGDPTVDKFHCYECGKPEVAHASLFPRAPVVVLDSDSDAKGHTLLLDNGMAHPGSQRLPHTKSSWDFNVCTPCYLIQRAEVYPDDDFTLGTMKLKMNAEVRRLESEYKEAVVLAWAREIIAKHESKEN